MIDSDTSAHSSFACLLKKWILHQFRNRLRRYRLGEKISLYFVAAHGLELVQLRSCFHTLGYDVDIQTAPYRHNGFTQGLALIILAEFADERLVDLDHVDIQALQLRQ